MTAAALAHRPFQQHRELVAPEPSEEPAAADEVPVQPIGDPPQASVPFQMPQSIVDFVKIDRRRARNTPVAPRPRCGQRGRPLLLPGPPIGQARSRVRKRQMRQHSLLPPAASRCRRKRTISASKQTGQPQFARRMVARATKHRLASRSRPRPCPVWPRASRSSSSATLASDSG